MTVSEKVAYLKGMAEGMEWDASSNQGRLLRAMINILEDVAASLSAMDARVEEMSKQVDEIDDDLASIEDFCYGDEGEDEPAPDDAVYEVECPKCHNTICFGEDLASQGTIECPNCGEKMEFNFEDIDSESAVQQSEAPESKPEA